MFKTFKNEFPKGKKRFFFKINGKKRRKRKIKTNQRYCFHCYCNGTLMVCGRFVFIRSYLCTRCKFNEIINSEAYISALAVVVAAAIFASWNKCCSCRKSHFII